MPLSALAGVLPRSAFRILYPWAARLSRLAGRRSQAVTVAVWHAYRHLVVRHSYWSGVTLPAGHVASLEQPVMADAREFKAEAAAENGKATGKERESKYV